MGRKTNYIRDVYSELEGCYNKIEWLEKELKSLKLQISLLEDENNRLCLQAEKNQQENQVLYMVIKEHFYQQEK